jgi:hypothetical protein
MNIYHYNDQDGIYLASGVADESPLEPGVYLIPAFATTVEPPVFKDGERAVFSNEAWTVEAIPPEPEPEPEPEPTPVVSLPALAEPATVEQPTTLEANQ